MAFEQFLTQKQDAKQSRRWRSVTYVASLLLHGAFFMGMLVRSFWHVEELRPPTVHVTLASLRPPPPPPPPPAPAPKAAAPQVKPRVVVQRPNEIVQPAAPKESPPAVAESESGEEGGEADGVEGGVEGGMAAAPPPPPPAPAPKHVEPLAILLPPTVGLGQRLSDLSDPRYRPSLPPQLNRAGMIVWGLYKICVAVDGHVDNVKVLKSADQLVDDRWVALIRSWEYRPYSIEGRAVPFCHAMRIEARAAL